MEENNRLFVVRKPIFVSSNSYLGRIKRKYKVKKAGFSGTLDPFASGNLIVAFGQYSKLFRFIKKAPKVYRATIWLGVSSDSYDIENVTRIKEHTRLSESKIIKTLESLKGSIEYLPPKYSAKKIDGKRAYELARDNQEFELKMSTMDIYDIKFINYNHPFITFETTVSEGAYIRSLAQIFLEKIDGYGTLSALNRLQEGMFEYQDEIPLDPREFLDMEENFYLNDEETVLNGKKIYKNEFKLKKSGIYFISFKNFFSIIEIYDESEEVKYILNRIRVC
jgi:tRNA pseudouridine55 synthase